MSIIFIYQSADAQYKFNISMSWDYNCHGNKQCEEVVRMYHSIVNGYLSKSNINFNSKSECEAARNMLIGNINEIKTMANQNRVKLNYTVSPCTGADGGKFVFLGPNRGTSFYSTNSANEIKNWSEDYIEQQLALNPEGQLPPSKSVQTNDVSFDKERADLRNEFVIDPDKKFVSLNMRNEWNSPDLDFLDVELKPVQFIAAEEEPFDEEKFEIISDWGKFGSDAVLTAYIISNGLAISSAAVLELSAGFTYNLYAELYKASRKISSGESYSAPPNIFTEASVYWGGTEYAVTGNILYNTATATMDDLKKIILQSGLEKGLNTNLSIPFLSIDAASLIRRTNSYMDKNKDIK